MWGGSIQGPQAVPGNYQARLITGEDSTTVTFAILKDPRSSSTQEDLQAQFDFQISVRDKLTETHLAIKQIRDVRKQVEDVTERLEDHEGMDKIKEAGKALVEQMTEIEESLYQTKNQSRQDPLNFPIRLNNKLAAVSRSAAFGDYRPTEQAIAVKDEMSGKIDAELAKLQTILDADLPAFNKLVADSAVPAIIIKKKKVKPEMTSK